MAYDRGLARSIVCAAMIGLVALPAHAEFPPDGADADPNNPAVASGIYPMPTRDGVGMKYVFYFDCGIGMWIGVAVTSYTQSEFTATLGPGREFPSGPPPGARRDPANHRHAIDPATGADYILRDGTWHNSRTGAVVTSPKLCTGTSFVPARPRPKGVAENAAPVDRPLFPDAYRPPIGATDSAPAPKPDKLPGQPAYLPNAAHGVLDPSAGPVRIAIPRPNGKTDVLH